jgi:DNA-binding beta-propeller fold protein YncE
MRFPPHLLRCACIAAVALSITARAGGLFWSDRPSGTQSIRACNFDRSSVRSVRDVTSNDPRGIVVDIAGGRIYFLTRTPGALQSIDFNNGGYIQHITGLTQPADLRLDGVNRVLYWCEETGGTIRKAVLPALPSVPGTLTPVTVFSGISSPYYLDLDVSAGRLYWGQNGSSIFSGPLGGGAPDPALYTGGLNNRGVCVDAAAGMLYWAERDGAHVIRRRPISGGTIQNVYSGLDTPHGLVLDIPAGKMYWVDTGTNAVNGFNARGVSRGDLDGSTPAEIIVAGTASNQPWDIDIDPRTLSYGDWRARFFRLDAGASLTAKAADPDRDGLLNLLEYALGTPPLRGNSEASFESLQVTENSTDYAAIRFRRRAGATDLTYRVQVSNDLVTWHDNTSPAGGPYTVEMSVAPAGEGLEWVTTRAVVPISQSPPQQFFRLAVDAPSAAPLRSPEISKKQRRRAAR